MLLSILVCLWRTPTCQRSLSPTHPQSQLGLPGRKDGQLLQSDQHTYKLRQPTKPSPAEQRADPPADAHLGERGPVPGSLANSGLSRFFGWGGGRFGRLRMHRGCRWRKAGQPGGWCQGRAAGIQGPLPGHPGLRWPGPLAVHPRARIHGHCPAELRGGAWRVPGCIIWARAGCFLNQLSFSAAASAPKGL